MSRLRVWLVIFPLVMAGTEGAAALLDSFAPKRYETAELFSRSNASHVVLPLVVAAGAALLLWALCSLATRAPPARRLPRLMFVALPPLAFTVQEHVEYVVGRGHVPTTLVFDRTVLVGLLLQVPFALAAYLLVRPLVKAAAWVAERLGAARPPARLSTTRSLRPRREVCARGRLLDHRRPSRGPPRLIAA